MLLHMGCHSCSTPCKRETDLERERVKREPSADQLEGGDNDQLGGGDNVQLGGGVCQPAWRRSLPTNLEEETTTSLEAKMRVLHLIGSSTSDFHFHCSLMYAR